MGIYEGLDAIRKHKEDQEARKAAVEANKINWLKIEPNETVKVWFLQELDRSAEGYVKDAPLGIMATEHTNPENWQKKALCTIEDGQCLGCEKHKEDWKAGWRQKSRLYINVLVERANGDREVAVMSQANGSKSVIAPMLLEMAVDENTITDRWWKITRTGKGSETSYLPRPQAPSKDITIADYLDKLNDLNRAVRNVPYDEQFDFYFAAPADAVQDTPAPAAGGGWPSDSKGADEEW